jgi:hypothetical protein
MPAGLTCGPAANKSLECIGGQASWEGGYVAVYLFISVLFLAVIIVCVVLVRKSAPNHCFDLTYHDRCEGPLVHPYFNVGWRGFWFVSFFVVEAAQLVQSGYPVLQAYTVWNFIFQVITLGIGLQVALHFAFGHKAIFCGSERYQSVCERVHMLMLEIVFPLSVLVCLVVWCVMAPRQLALQYLNDAIAVTRL